MASYSPSLNDIADISDEEDKSYTPSAQDVSDIPDDDAHQTASQQLIAKAVSQSQKPTGDYLDTLLANSSLVPTDFGIKAALSNYNPGLIGRQIVQSAGKPLMAVSPELAAEPNLLSGLINAAGRIGTGTLATTSQDVNNINSLPDLINSLKSNAQLNAAIEAPAIGTRVVGGAAELLDPIKYAEYQGNNIEKGADIAQQKMEEAYAPSNQKYNAYPMIPQVNSQFGITDEEKLHFTPNANKALKIFNMEPTYYNATQLRAALGKDAAKVSGVPSEVNKYQSLTNAREKVIDAQRGLLKTDQDPRYLASFDRGQQIARDEYYPYFSSDLLSDLSEGNQTNLTGKKLVNDIRQASSGRNPTIPQEHPLINISEHLQNKINRGELLQDVPALAPIFGGGVGGGILGALLGDLSSHKVSDTELAGGAGLGLGASTGALLKYLEPSFLRAAQNPYLVKHLANLIQPLYYSAAREGESYINQ
jgi:hypothetical protein